MVNVVNMVIGFFFFMFSLLSPDNLLVNMVKVVNMVNMLCTVQQPFSTDKLLVNMVNVVNMVNMIIFHQFFLFMFVNMGNMVYVVNVVNMFWTLHQFCWKFCFKVFFNGHLNDENFYNKIFWIGILCFLSSLLTVSRFKLSLFLCHFFGRKCSVVIWILP